MDAADRSRESEAKFGGIVVQKGFSAQNDERV